MFNKQTVFVIGAGSSVEFGMPSGETLKAEIAELLSIQTRAKNTDRFARFRAMLMNIAGQNWQTLLDAGSHIAAAMPTFVSIDEALHYFSADTNAVHVGKLAIANLILDYEAKSTIVADRQNGRIHPGRCSETWLAEFLSMALSFARREEVQNVFAKVTFINFNYDRILEQYLSAALQGIGRLPANQAKAVTNGLKVIRPYGSLGKLPWQGPAGVEFGLDPHPHASLNEIAKGLVTYTEQTDDGDIRNAISIAMDAAELIVFIGFGFHQQNMALLKSGGGNRPVFATAYKIDKDNYSLFSDNLTGFFGSNVRLFDKKGYELMRTLRPTISAAAS